MSKYSVSVIIPCYNSSKYVKKTIDSALNQNYENYEIIAIDDGSMDGTREILESYLPKIRILSHLKNANLGQAASLNLGINETKSHLIAFLDSDDIWYPNKIKKQVDIFEEYRGVGIVYTNGYVIDENDKILFRLFLDNFREENIRGQMLLKCYIKTPSSVMVKREIFNKTGLFKNHLHSMDHDMWIRMSEVSKFCYLDQFLTAYRKHRGSKSLDRRQWEDGFSILREACERYPYGIYFKRKRRAVLYYRLGEYDWMHNNYLSALFNFLFSCLFDPWRAFQYVWKKIKVR